MRRIRSAIAVHSIHVYEVRPRRDKRGVDLISDRLPFGRLWYGESNAVSNAVDYAKFFSRSHRAVVRVYDGAGNAIEWRFLPSSFILALKLHADLSLTFSMSGSGQVLSK